MVRPRQLCWQLGAMLKVLLVSGMLAVNRQTNSLLSWWFYNSFSFPFFPCLLTTLMRYIWQFEESARIWLLFVSSLFFLCQFFKSSSESFQICQGRKVIWYLTCLNLIFVVLPPKVVFENVKYYVSVWERTLYTMCWCLIGCNFRFLIRWFC